MSCGRMGTGLAGLWAIGGKLTQKDMPDTSEEAHCQECGWGITGGFSWCPQCGARLKPYRCEYCRGMTPRDAQECPHCGAPVI